MNKRQEDSLLKEEHKELQWSEDSGSFEVTLKGVPSGAFQSGFSKKVEAPLLHSLLEQCPLDFVRIRYREGISNKDIPALKDLHNEWFPVHYNDKFFEHILMKRDRIIVAEAKLENKFHIVGCITFRIKKSKAKFRRAKASDYLFFLKEPRETCSAYVMTLGVVAELRGKGVAQELFREMGLALKSNGLEYVYLDVIDYNAPALRFYAKMGFVEFRKKRKHYTLGEKTHDGIVLIKYEREDLRKVPFFILRPISSTLVGAFNKPKEVLFSLCKKKRSEKTTSS